MTGMLYRTRGAERCPPSIHSRFPRHSKSLRHKSLLFLSPLSQSHLARHPGQRADTWDSMHEDCSLLLTHIARSHCTPVGPLTAHSHCHCSLLLFTPCSNQLLTPTDHSYGSLLLHTATACFLSTPFSECVRLCLLTMMTYSTSFPPVQRSAFPSTNMARGAPFGMQFC
jgi:hypothetical protein